MKKIFMMLLAVVFLVGAAAPAVYAVPAAQSKAASKVKSAHKAQLKDVKGHWAENVLFEMNAKGFVKGYQDCTFRPSQVVSNLEAVVMLVRALGLEDEAKEAKLSAPVKNAKQISSWAAGYLQVAYEQGILTESELKSFKPNQGAKRIEVALMITRALDLDQRIGDKISVKFLDNQDIPGDFNGVVIIMVQTGIMQGTPGNYFLPNKPVTRAEMAVLLGRIDGKVIDKDKKEVSGEIKSVDDDSITIVKNGQTKKYEFSEDVTVYVNGKAADIDDLEKGFRAKLVLDNDGKVVFVRAEEVEDVKSFEGKITQIVLGTDSCLTIKSGTKSYSFKVNSSTEIEKDGKEIFLAELEIGWDVTIEAKDGIAVEISVDDNDEEEEFSGEIVAITLGNKQTIIIETNDDDEYVFDVTDDTKIELDGDSAELDDLKVGDEVEILSYNGTALRINAERTED